jgi:hypothetical protein
MSDNVKDAVRMVGYLLETNSCTNAYAKARNGRRVDSLSTVACKWCLYGAVEVVARTLNLQFTTVQSSVSNRLAPNNFTGGLDLIHQWEGSDYYINRQDWVIERLKSA